MLGRGLPPAQLPEASDGLMEAVQQATAQGNPMATRAPAWRRIGRMPGFQDERARRRASSAMQPSPSNIIA